MHVFRSGKIGRRQSDLFTFIRFGAVRTLGLIQLRTKVRVGVLPLLAQPILIQLRQRHLRTH